MGQAETGGLLSVHHREASQDGREEHSAVTLDKSSKLLGVSRHASATLSAWFWCPTTSVSAFPFTLKQKFGMPHPCSTPQWLSISSRQCESCSLPGQPCSGPDSTLLPALFTPVHSHSSACVVSLSALGSSSGASELFPFLGSPLQTSLLLFPAPGSPSCDGSLPSPVSFTFLYVHTMCWVSALSFIHPWLVLQ